MKNTNRPKYIVGSVAGLTLLAGAVPAFANNNDPKPCPELSAQNGDHKPCQHPTTTTGLPSTTSSTPPTQPPTTPSSSSSSTSTSAPTPSTTTPDSTPPPTTPEPSSTPPETPGPTSTVPMTTNIYDPRCGGAVTITSNRREEVTIEPLGYHLTVSSTPATLQLKPGSYSIMFGDSEVGSFVIEACPPPTTPNTGAPVNPPTTAETGTPPTPPATPAPAPRVPVTLVQTL